MNSSFAIQRILLLAVTGALVCATPAAVAAATCTWTGAGADALWSSAANWSGCGGVAPQNGDALVFPDGAARPVNQNDIASLGVISIAITGIGAGNERYSISGVGVTLTTGNGLLFNAANDGSGLGPEFLAPIRLGVAVPIVNLAAGPGVATIGPIDINGLTLTLNAAGADILASGAFTSAVPFDGLPAVQKIGPRMAILDHPSNNFAGNVRVNAGTLRVRYDGALGVPYMETRVEAGAVLDMQGDLRVENPLDLNGGTLTSSGGSVLWIGEIRLTADSIVDVSQLSGISIVGRVTGPHSLTKNGTGQLLLEPVHRNTFGSAAEPLTVNDGVLIAGAFGMPSIVPIPAFVAAGAQLHLFGGATLNGLAGAGNVWIGDGTLTVFGGPSDFSGQIQTNPNPALNQGMVIAASAFTLRGSGPDGGIVVSDSGSLVLANPAGPVVKRQLLAGSTTVRLDADNQFDDGVTVQLWPGTVLDLNGHDESVAQLEAPAGGTIELRGATLTLGAGTIDARIRDSGAASSVTKTGDGLLVLGATNTYSGVTRIEAGRLRVNGTQPGSEVRLIAGILEGTGRVGPIIATGGNIVPGADTVIGRLSTGSLTLSVDASIVADVSDAAPDGAHDELRVIGTIDLANATLVVKGTMPRDATFMLIENDGDDPIAGTFAGLPEGATLDIGGSSFRISYAGGTGNDVVLVPGELTYLLAEGATGTFFDYDLLIANPNDTAAPVTVTFFREAGGTVVETRTVAAQSRVTIRVDDIAGLEAASVSAQVTSTSGLPLAVERTMFWDESYYGGHTAEAVRAAAANWYFAEGAQGFFDTYVLIVNANAEAADVTFTFLRENESPVIQTLAVAGHGRLTVPAAQFSELAGRSFGISVSATRPVVAERAMYFATTPQRLWSGGHGSVGVPATNTVWQLPEGATGDFFETFVLLANPSDTETHADLTFLGAGGEQHSVRKVLPPFGRVTVNLDAETIGIIPPGAMATIVNAAAPIVAERSMYWAGEAPPWGEAHNTFGLIGSSSRWGLAEGRVGGPFDFRTYVLLSNTSDMEADVSVTFLRESGTPVVKTYSVPPQSRFNLDVSTVTELQNESFGVDVRILNGAALFVERSMYWNAIGAFWAGGTNASAVAIP